jgi:hypothetical protein
MMFRVLSSIPHNNRTGEILDAGPQLRGQLPLVRERAIDDSAGRDPANLGTIASFRANLLRVLVHMV